MATIDKDKINELINQIQTNLNNFNNNDILITSIILDIIKNHLLKDLYEDIPKELDEILSFHDFTSSIDLSKKILLTYGIPEHLINKLSIVDIQKILKSLQLFLSDQSTIKFIKDIVDLFDEDIYIAELNLVYNKDLDDVYLVPEWIIKPPASLESKYSIISYDTAYNSIPELLITKNEWLTQFRNNNAVSPQKTNILLIVSNNQQTISLMNEIISQIIFNYLKSRKVILYYDKTFEVQFEDIIRIYYYIVALFKNISKLTINQPSIVEVQYSAENNTISFSEIETVISKYNKIKDKSTYDKFKQYIKQKFTQLTHPQPTEYDFIDLQSYLYAKYPALIQYLNSVYNNSTNKEYDLYSLIIKTKKSISINFYNVPYIDIFIKNYLFAEQIPIEERISYQFINYYKPVNILILSEIVDYILLTINDKLTNLYIESFVKSIYITKQNIDNAPIRYDKKTILSILNKSLQHILDISCLYNTFSKKDNLNIDDHLDTIYQKIENKDDTPIEYIKTLILHMLIRIRNIIYDISTLEIDLTKSNSISIFDELDSIRYKKIHQDQLEFYNNDVKSQDIVVDKSPRIMINDYVNIMIN